VSERDQSPPRPPAELSDEELEAELTIAASHPRREDRYAELLAEHDRRRGGDPRD
jgi:hypothetical protein